MAEASGTKSEIRSTVDKKGMAVFEIYGKGTQVFGLYDIDIDESSVSPELRRHPEDLLRHVLERHGFKVQGVHVPEGSVLAHCQWFHEEYPRHSFWFCDPGRRLW